MIADNTQLLCRHILGDLLQNHGARVLGQRVDRHRAAGVVVVYTCGGDVDEDLCSIE